MSPVQLDARRLLCPMPVIRTQQQIAKMSVGEQLEVWCTDPGTLHDLPTWCRLHGHRVAEQSQQDHEFRFLIVIGALHSN